MKKWSAYLLFWLLLLGLEVYIEYAWIRQSLEAYSLGFILRIVLLTELSTNLARIPVAIALERVLSRSMGTVYKVLASLGILMAGLLLYRLIGVYYILDILYRAAPEDQAFFDLVRLNSGLLNLLFTSVLYLAFVQYRKTQKLKANTQLLEKENLENELRFLKAQLNPHFLFNTLNNLYGLARRQDKNTPQVILQLSELLRFMLYEANTQSITIDKELTMLEKYLALERIRYNDRLQVSYRTDIANRSFAITPLLITHMVENAFKHGISESIAEAFIEIEVKQTGSTCELKIANSKSPKPAEENGQIGLKNITRQLDLIYQDYELEIDETDTVYALKLKLPYSL